MADEGAPDHWFEPMADHLGSAYLRYSFTKGTANEVAFLDGRARARAGGSRVLDVGCGPGRHARALAARGIVGPRGGHLAALRRARHRRCAAGRHLRATRRARAALRRRVRRGDLALPGSVRPGRRPDRRPLASLGDPDGGILAGMARAVRPGGRVAVSAFSAYFQVRFLEDADTFDADQRGQPRADHPEGRARRSRPTHDLWTSCFTPRELRLLARAAGLVPEEIWSVTPAPTPATPRTSTTPSSSCWPAARAHPPEVPEAAEPPGGAAHGMAPGSPKPGSAVYGRAQKLLAWPVPRAWESPARSTVRIRRPDSISQRRRSRCPTRHPPKRILPLRPPNPPPRPR